MNTPPKGYRLLICGEVSQAYHDICARLADDHLLLWQRVHLAHNVVVGPGGIGIWSGVEWIFCRPGNPEPQPEKEWLNPWD